MKTRTGYLGALALYFFCAILQADEPPAKREAASPLLQQLRSEDQEVRYAAWLGLTTRREETVSVLMIVVSHWEEYPAGKLDKLRAIELLGEYRAAEAARLLVDEIDWAGAEFGSALDSLAPFPAAKAILRIGDPAIRVILESRMVREVTDRQLKLYAYVIWHHYVAAGQDVGLFRMQRLLDRWKAERETRAERTGTDRDPDLREQDLARLIQMYQTIDPRDMKDWPSQVK